MPRRSKMDSIRLQHLRRGEEETDGYETDINSEDEAADPRGASGRHIKDIKYNAIFHGSHSQDEDPIHTAPKELRNCQGESEEALEESGGKESDVEVEEEEEEDGPALSSGCDDGSLSMPRRFQNSEKSVLTLKHLTTTPHVLCCCTASRNAVLLVHYILVPLLCIGCDLADTATDILVACFLYWDEKYVQCDLTLLFVLSPSIAYYLLAIHNLVTEYSSTYSKKIAKLLAYSCLVWLLVFCPVGTYCYLQMLYYGIKALRNKEMSAEHIRAWKKLQDESLPAYYVIKAFLECAPQLALQLYILLSNPLAQQHRLTILIQIVSCTLSLVSMAGKSIQFRKYIQEAKMVAYSDDRGSNCVTCFWNSFLLAGDYLWWFCSISARMVAIVIFASVFHAWIFLVCLAHAVVMVLWIVYNQPKRSVEKFFISLFVGVMYIFCFIEYKVDFGKTSLLAKYAFYYLLMICQNSALVLSAYFLNDASPFLQKVHHPLVIVHYVATLVDLVFMVGYLLHSKRDELLKRANVQHAYSL